MGGHKNNPIGYRRFDEGQGDTAYDRGVIKEITGSGHDGTLTNMSTSGTSTAWSVSGKSGSALRFDGINDYVLIPDNDALDIADELTISAWINPSNFPYTEAEIVDKGRGSVTSYRFQLRDSDELAFQAYFGGNYTLIKTAGLNIPKNIWSHVLVTYDGDKVRLYFNGELQKVSASLTGNLGTNASPIYIGYWSDSSYNFQGMMDEIKVYNYTLTQDEIRQEYNQGQTVVLSQTNVQKQASSDGLIAWWKMDEDSWSGTTGEVIDYSGTGSHGTAVNSANTTSTAKFGRAGYFSQSTDDRVSVTTPSVNFATTDYTFETWIKRDGAGDRDTIIYGSGPHFGIESSNVLFWNNHDGSNKLYYGNATISADTWTHIAISIGREYIKFYVNGELDAQRVKNEVASTCTNWYIGYVTSANSWNLTGILDNLKIYANERTASQIMRDYADGPPPVGYWSMDKKTGMSVADDSGRGNDGSFGGTPTWKNAVSCKYGNCLHFDGVDDAVDFGNADEANFGTENFSITAWMRFDASSFDAYKHLLSKYLSSNPSWTFVTFPSNSIHFEPRDSDAVNEADLTFSSIPTKEWFHIGVSADRAGNITGYLNGVEVQSRDMTSVGDMSTSDTLKFMRSTTLGSGFSLDEVKIYNYALTQRQIMEDYNGGGPVGYWKFDEGEGGTVYDNSGNGNDCTLFPGTSGNTTSTMWSNGASGKLNGSLDFDGTDDWVDVSDTTFTVDEPWSFSIWLKAADGTNLSWAAIIGGPAGSGGGYWMFHNPDASLTWYQDYYSSVYYGAVTGSAEGPYSLNLGDEVPYDEWFQLTVVSEPVDADESDVTAYINGGEYSEKKRIQWSPRPVTQFTVDALGTNKGGRYWDGQLDEFKLWNYALTPEEVGREYNGGFSTYFK